ncbi:hypothetical protein MY10362_001369 [Beauveria mimosiformis]
MPRRPNDIGYSTAANWTPASCIWVSKVMRTLDREFAGLVSARSEVLDMGTAAETCGAAGAPEKCDSKSVGVGPGPYGPKRCACPSLWAATTAIVRKEMAPIPGRWAGGRKPGGRQAKGKQRASFGPGVVETAKAPKREAVGQAMRMVCTEQNGKSMQRQSIVGGRRRFSFTTASEVWQHQPRRVVGSAGRLAGLGQGVGRIPG